MSKNVVLCEKYMALPWKTIVELWYTSQNYGIMSQIHDITMKTIVKSW